MPGTLPRMPSPLIISRRRLVAMSSGKVLPMNREISPTSRGSDLEQRSCKVRVGELAGAGGTATAEAAMAPGSKGSGGEGAGAAAIGGGSGTGDGAGTAVGCAVADGSAATCAGQPSCKVRRR